MKCEVGGWSIQGLELWVLGLGAVALGSNPILNSGLDLCPLVLDSSLPGFVNSQLVASCQLAFLIIFLLSLCFSFQIIKSGVPVN